MSAMDGFLIMPINFINISSWNIKGFDYCCIISGICKSESINWIQTIDLTNKSGTLWNINFIIRYKNG